ncbi:60S ribosomal protein L27 [Cantharellus anzutake]|uniref:60S ribosomal protein L27 n=1 Tax=Cantharellus anzutake TaxID=1750568 RepID=UPI0019052F21|nr:60S ribosomal protein L27 [Cantharellus anzutake]KAF8343090.1 60S ribosomal protein L27 [Cantharellus anzutake]
MPKIYKPGKVAIVLQGRQAGKKAVILKHFDDGSKRRPYPYAVIAGIQKYPRKVTRNMGRKRLEKRSKVKPFIKIINAAHLFPTRYALELDGIKSLVAQDTFDEPTQRKEAKKALAKVLGERYTAGKNRWFFTALRF